MKTSSSRQLLHQKRFGPYFVAQFLGAFNDNLFKNALLIIVAFGAARSEQEIGLINNLAAGLFILPFFLFALVAGNIADTVDKQLIIKRLKLTECLLALASVPALLSGDVKLMLAVLFGFGLQSAFFAPAKYSLLPQHLAVHELVGGNALVQMGTFVAILVGTLVGGIFASSEILLYWLCGLIVGVALLGYVFACFVPPAPPSQDTTAKVDWNIWRMGRLALGEISQTPGILLSIIAVSWFWFLGTVVLTQLPSFSKSVLGGDATVVSVLLAIFSVGIGVGSLLCGRLSAGRLEIGLVPLGAIGMAIFGSLFAYAPTAEGLELVNAAMFFGRLDGFWIGLHVVMIGVFGGLYIVPLMALIQAKTRSDMRGRTMAINSVMNALFMVVAALFSIIVLVLLKWQLSTLLLLSAMGNLLVLAVIVKAAPAYFIRMIMWLAAQTTYRLRVSGRRHIPESGPALIVANHVSVIDWMLLGAACVRPLRFVVYRPFYNIRVLRPVLRWAGAIPITSRDEDERCYREAMAAMVQALQNGELVLVFPERKLGDATELEAFHTDFEQVLDEVQVPVIPAALRGFAGTSFSQRWWRAIGKPFAKEDFRTELQFAPAIAPEAATAKALQRHLSNMLTKGEHRE
ncbi:MFS transporter [uncultured Umboniibacter sp.]|uniref:MFS transporter n=1 Tax=uncultured Umboniibacter sp. TaxID=1798917 RepID=UPI002613A8CF|nr:MFS transporter [uncultured Umboniibacter sp.]